MESSCDDYLRCLYFVLGSWVFFITWLILVHQHQLQHNRPTWWLIVLSDASGGW